VLLLTILPTLSVAEYGRYSLIFIIATQIMFLSKSLVLNPMIKFAAEPGRFDRVSQTGLLLSLGTVILLGGMIAASAPLTAKIFRLEVKDILLASLLPLAFWLRDWGFCAQQTLYRTGRLFAVEAVYYVGVSVGCIWIWSKGQGVAGDVVAVNLFAAGASSLLALVLKPKSDSVTLRDIRSESGPLLRYGFYTLGIGVSANLLAGADILVIGAIYNPEIVGIYSGAKRIYAVASTLISTVGLLVMPYASRLTAEGRGNEMRALLEKSLAYVTLGLVGVTIVGWFSADRFYHIFLPESYAASAPLLKILLIAAPFEGIYNISGSILYGAGAATAVAATSALGLVALGALLPLGAYFYSLTGAATSQVIGACIVGLIMYLKASRQTGSTLSGITTRLLDGFKSGLRLISGKQS